MIVFDHKAIQKNISSKEVHHEIFKGVNLSTKPVKIVAHGSTCSCTVGKLPLNDIQPNDLFEVELIVDKVGRTGFYSVGLDITFSDGNKSEKLTLNLNGEVI